MSNEITKEPGDECKSKGSDFKPTEHGLVNPSFYDEIDDNSSISMTSINLDNDCDHKIRMEEERETCFEGTRTQVADSSQTHDQTQTPVTLTPRSLSKSKSQQGWTQDNNNIKNENKKDQDKDRDEENDNRSTLTLRDTPTLPTTTGTGTETGTGTGTGTGSSSETERDQWDRPIEFLLSCISMSVGLGNVWRFPFTCYENGGGCFLIVYLIVLALVGRPIYFLELVIGQFSSSGPIKVWKMVPFLKGVGYGQMIGATCVASYYVSIMGLTVFYFFASLQSYLPWSVCDPSWAGECDANKTASLLHANMSLSQLYFENEVLKQKMTIENGIGYPQWRLTLCLLFSWIVIFFVLFKGIKSSGKSAYFTSIFPYVVIIILLIRGVTLEGAWDGIYFFVVPRWDRLYDIQIWYAAVGQCFLSLGAGFGIITMLSSYNKFGRNIYRDAMIISAADTFTSILAGVTIFAILGNLAHELDVDISKVVDAGPGLAFESLPYAIAKFKWIPQVFSVLFFFMVFTIGLGSACSLANTLVTVILDEFPALKRWLLVLMICVLGFLFGLIYVTPGGQFMVTLVDYYGVSFLLYLMAVLEAVGVSWFYGMDNICEDVEFMLKFKLSWYWKFCWKYLVPLSLGAILVYSITMTNILKYNGVEFPISAIISGRIMATISLMSIPICAFHTVWKRKADTYWEKFKGSFSPSTSWGPQDPVIREEWRKFKAKVN